MPPAIVVVLQVLFFLVFVAVVVHASIGHSPGGFEAWRVRRRHRRMMATPIAELPELAPGRIFGCVAAGEQVLTAPLTGRPCVHYTVVILVRRGKRWETCATKRRGVSFTVADETGRALIEPANAQLAPTFDHTESIGWFDSATPEQEALLARHSVSLTGILWNRRFRFHEAVIAIGDPVCLIGAGVREIDPAARTESGYRSAAPTRLRIANSAEAPLSILCGPPP